MQGNSSIGAATSQEYVCDICTLSCKREEMDGLECGHLFCKQCWDSYLRVMIVDEGRSVTSLCSLCVVYCCVFSVVIDYLLCLYILWTGCGWSQCNVSYIYLWYTCMWYYVHNAWPFSIETRVLTYSIIHSDLCFKYYIEWNYYIEW